MFCCCLPKAWWILNAPEIEYGKFLSVCLYLLLVRSLVRTLTLCAGASVLLEGYPGQHGPPGCEVQDHAASESVSPQILRFVPHLFRLLFGCARQNIRCKISIALFWEGASVNVLTCSAPRSRGLLLNFLSSSCSLLRPVPLLLLLRAAVSRCRFRSPSLQRWTCMSSAPLLCKPSSR